MKIVRNKYLPIGNKFAAINLFGVFFVKNDVKIDDALVNHESIHTAQMRELLYLGFYLCYVIEWLFWLIVKKGRGIEAYYNISFEREAYKHAGEADYLQRRRIYSQWRKRSI